MTIAGTDLVGVPSTDPSAREPSTSRPWDWGWTRLFTDPDDPMLHHRYAPYE